MLKVECFWTVRERRAGRWVVVLRQKNIWTTYGLGALAAAIAGGYAAPQYLVIDTDYATLSTAYSLGVSSIQLSKRVDITGDTQLIVNPGGGNQETVTFSGVAGTVYTLVGTLANNHSASEPVVRAPRASDTLATVISEIQYDATNDPGNRLSAAGTGYSSGTGNWSSQFYFTGTQALVRFMALGLSETQAVGTGNLHNHIALGYDHTSGGNDVEIDVSLTLSN